MTLGYQRDSWQILANLILHNQRYWGIIASISFNYKYQIENSEQMRPSRPKMLCKFKQTCKNYSKGLECSYSHQKCKFGKDCPDRQACLYTHQINLGPSKMPNKFQKPKQEVQCKYGVNCKKRPMGQCPFKHTDTGSSSPARKPQSKMFEMRPPQPPKQQTMCQFGQRCNKFPLGKCPYKHPQAIVASQVQVNAPPANQNQLSMFETLCLKFITNNQCEQNCRMVHEFSESNTISKIFQISHCQKIIKKIMIMEPYQPDQQPLYVLVGNNRIAFVQLTNLAKQSGNQSIGNNSLVMKRWCDRDIHFERDQILNAWLIKAENENNQRADIIVCKCKESIRLVVINRQKSFNFPMNGDIVSVIFISSVLMILLSNKKTVSLQFDFVRADFRQRAAVITEPLNFLRKYHKSVQGEEFAAGATPDSGLYFINKKLQTHSIKLPANARDVCFTEYQNLPTAIVLTQQGKVQAINLLTFQMTTLLQGKFRGSQLNLSSLALTNQHLIIAIDWIGVLVYNYERFDKAVGVLGMGNHKWGIQCDQRGNLAMVSQNSSGKIDAGIFKIRKF